MVGRRSLLEDLEELVNPMPQDVDPDQADAADPTAARLPAEDQQLAALTKDMQPRDGKQGRLPLRAGIAVPEEEMYHGKATSRQRVFGDEDGGLSDEDGEGEEVEGEGEEVEDKSGGEGQEGGDEDLANANRPAGKRLRDGSAEVSNHEEMENGDLQTEEGEGEGEGEEEEEEDGDDMGTEGVEDGDEELKALEAGYSALQAAEAKAVADMQERNQKEVMKGRGARNQQLRYERILELRILLQKALAGSNSLPLPDTCASLLQGSNDQQADDAQPAFPPAATVQSVEGLQQRWHGLRSAAQGVLVQLVQLYDTMVAAPQSLAHGSIQEQPAPPQQPSLGGRAVDKLWQTLSCRYEALAPFRDASLDRWHARAVLGSGSTTRHNATSQQLRALHQSTSRQVADMMAQQSANLIRRSRLPVGQHGHRHFGELHVTNPNAQEQGALDMDGTDHAAGYGAAVQRDDETYDDGELYQQLLKEFLEQGGSGAQVLAGRPAKKRKVVDRRASKGRKIRYIVQEKLVNFMSAVHMEPPVFADQLFANLFGHSSSS